MSIAKELIHRFFAFLILIILLIPSSYVSNYLIKNADSISPWFFLQSLCGFAFAMISILLVLFSCAVWFVGWNEDSDE